MKSRKAGKAEQFPATLAQHVFIVDVERVPYWAASSCLRRRVSKADLVGLGERTFDGGLSSKAKDYGAKATGCTVPSIEEGVYDVQMCIFVC